MTYKLFFGTLDTEEGFIFDTDFLFTEYTVHGQRPEVVMPRVKEQFIEKYKCYLKSKRLVI